MCWDVIIDGKSYGTQGELAGAIGKDNLVLDRYYDKTALKDDMCLCPIDFEATAAKIGRTVTDRDENGEFDCFGVRFLKA